MTENEVVGQLVRRYGATNENLAELIGRRLVPRLQRLAAIFGGLENVKGKRVLDLGCGAAEGPRPEADSAVEWSPADARDGDFLEVQHRMWEPWFLRAVHVLGGEAVGIDIGDLSSEAFEHHQVDLTKEGALDFLPGGTFDVVTATALLDDLYTASPDGEWKRLPQDEAAAIAERLGNEAIRLCKEDGVVLIDRGLS